MRDSRVLPTGLAPHISAGNTAAESAGCSSEGQPSQVLVRTRKFKWIRFLVRRLRCIYVRDEHRVRESRSTSQGTIHSGRRRRMPLRHRRRASQDEPIGKQWHGRPEGRSSAGVAPRAAELPVSRGGETERNSAVPLNGASPFRTTSVSAIGGVLSEPLCIIHSRSLGDAADAEGPVPDAQDVASDGVAERAAISSSLACEAGGREASDKGQYSRAQTDPSLLMADADTPEALEAAESLATVPGAACDPAALPFAIQVGMWPLVSLEPIGVNKLGVLLDSLEEQRMRFNRLQRQAAGPPREGHVWDRRGEVEELSGLLIRASIHSMLSADCQMPCVHSNDGIQVWKGETGVGNFACRASFLLPLEPRRYAMFASNAELRSLWDKNMTEQHVVEQLDVGHDICYVAFRRIATVYPRDVVTLRAKCRLHLHPLVAETAPMATRNSHEDFISDDCMTEKVLPSEEDKIAYTSMSCSIHHPDVPETPGRVRMDIRINAYLARPVRTPFGLWSEVTLVNESDSGGWIPAAITRNMSAKLLPSTVERFSVQILKH
ncbi:hypothetical protein cyc_02884 [Cyclospora cayetanensis]|uniref:START domain-containing protein n=1 Tax=Cyclospora cayetanensis TaxID=88456 RepID=A0A1D3D1N6_9EIME|nr:hypothetical protein cyc_02884 [Cyclospora cayetanensis]